VATVAAKLSPLENSNSSSGDRDFNTYQGGMSQHHVNEFVWTQSKKQSVSLIYLSEKAIQSNFIASNLVAFWFFILSCKF